MNTPILFLIFNRPKETKRVFERLRMARPRYLFIAADGARADVPTDAERCAQARAVVANIDWDCEVNYLFREHNLGCGKAVSSAIMWFFEQVEEGIILEDDCLPDPSFFVFCETMLTRYRHEPRVMQISGSNYLFGTHAHESSSYYFSAYNLIWGWATWRRAWQHYQYELTDFTDMPALLAGRFTNPDFIKWIEKSCAVVVTGEVDTWDAQWHWVFQKNEGLCVTPCPNLVTNIGHIGAHFKHKTPFNNMKTTPFCNYSLPLPPLSIDYEKDAILAKNVLNPPRPLGLKIELKLRRIWQRLFR